MGRLINEINDQFGVWSNIMDDYVFIGTMNECIIYEANDCIRNGKLEAVKCMLERQERGKYIDWRADVLRVEDESEWDHIIDYELNKLLNELKQPKFKKGDEVSEYKIV